MVSHKEPLRGSGSEGSEGSARFQRAGSKGKVSPLRGDEYIISLREMENHITALRALKNRQTELAPVGNAPLSPPVGGTSPGGGSFSGYTH